MASPMPVQPNVQAGNEKREVKGKNTGRGGHGTKDTRPAAATPVDPISRPEGAQQSQDQQPRDQQSQPNPSPAAQPYGGRGGRGSRGPRFSGRGEGARNQSQGSSQSRQGSGSGFAAQPGRGPPGLSGQRMNANDESNDLSGTGSSTGPQAFPSIPTASASTEQQGESTQQQQPHPPVVQQASVAVGGSSRQQQQASTRNSGPPPRPALTPTQTGIRHNPAFPGGEGTAKTYVLHQPANHDNNHVVNSAWMEITPNNTNNANTNTSTTVNPHEGFHQQPNQRQSGSGGPVTAPGVPPQGAERRGGQAGNGSSAARAARADSESLNASQHTGGAHANNGARGAVGVVQLLASSVGSSGAANRPIPPTPAARLPYSPNPHHVFPDDVTTPQSANIAAVAAHAAESTPAQRTQPSFNATAKQGGLSHGQHTVGGYAPITHAAKQTLESAMPFAASASMSAAAPAALAVPIPVAMASPAALGGIPVRNFSTLLNPSAAPFGKVVPSGVAMLQDIEGVMFEKADSQDLRSNANKIRSHMKERSVLEQQHAKLEQDILTEISRMEVEADKQANNQRAFVGVTTALEESRKECAEMTAILAGKDAELAHLAAQVDLKESQEEQIMAQLKNKDTQAWILQNESQELRVKMEELETTADNANAKNADYAQALDIKHGEFLHWYNAYHAGEAVANEKIAGLDALVKDLETQLRVKDGSYTRQDPGFAVLHNEQQHMQFGQHFTGPANGHMTDQQQQQHQQQVAIGSSAQSRPVPPGFQAPMFGQIAAAAGMDQSQQQQQHQMHSMMHSAPQQQQQQQPGNFEGGSGAHMGQQQQQYGASGQLGEGGGGGAGGFPNMFQPGFQSSSMRQPQQPQQPLFNRTLNAIDLIEKFSELIPDSLAQAVVWTTALDAELDKKLAPHTWSGHYAHMWGAPTFFLQQHSNVFAGRPDKSFYRITPLYTHQGGVVHGGSSGGDGRGNNPHHPGGGGPSVIPGISLQPLPGLPGMGNPLYANNNNHNSNNNNNNMNPQPNFGYGYSNN